MHLLDTRDVGNVLPDYTASHHRTIAISIVIAVRTSNLDRSFKLYKFWGIIFFSACHLLLAAFLLGLFFYSEDAGDIFLRNIGWLSADHTSLYPRTQKCIKYKFTARNMSKNLKGDKKNTTNCQMAVNYRNWFSPQMCEVLPNWTVTFQPPPPSFPKRSVLCMIRAGDLCYKRG
jgi:hypothetical protein